MDWEAIAAIATGIGLPLVTALSTLSAVWLHLHYQARREDRQAERQALKETEDREREAYAQLLMTADELIAAIGGSFSSQKLLFKREEQSSFVQAVSYVEIIGGQGVQDAAKALYECVSYQMNNIRVYVLGQYQEAEEIKTEAQGKGMWHRSGYEDHRDRYLKAVHAQLAVHAKSQQHSRPE